MSSTPLAVAGPLVCWNRKTNSAAAARARSVTSALDDHSLQIVGQPSLAEAIKTHRSTKSLANHRMKLQKVLGREASLDVDLATARALLDGDDEYDDEDLLFAADQRMYMPMFDRPAGARKGNSRKALKWLGLA